jgi:hypothetical protein
MSLVAKCGNSPLPRARKHVYSKLAARGFCRNHHREIAARLPSAGIHSHILSVSPSLFFSLTIKQLSPLGAPHVVNVHKRAVPAHQLGDIMKLSNLTFIAVALCVGTDISWISIARADEVLKFRIITHLTAVQTQEVGDVDGHTMSVGRYSGLASFPDGSVGTVNFTFTTDYIKGSGTYSTYYNVTLKDGSTLWWKGSGPAKTDGTTTVFPDAPVSVLRGTGRFEGAKGEGTTNGARLTPLATGAELYVDAVINVKK